MTDTKLIPYIVESIQTYWDMPAFTDYPGKAMSYGDAGRRIMWMHKLYKACGMKKGSKVAVVGKNCSSWALTWLSTVTFGGTIVPIMASFSPEDTQYIVNHSDSELLFINRDKFEAIDEDKLRKVKYIFALEDFHLLANRVDNKKELLPALEDTPELLKLGPSGFSPPDICDNEDIASIVYTSGTAGFSKGVMLPHRSLLANVNFAVGKLCFKIGANVFAFLPIAHAYASAFDMLYPVTRGNHINFLDKIPAPKLLLNALQDLKPNVVLTVPLLIEKIYKRQLQPQLESGKIKALLKIPLVKNMILKKIHNKLMAAFGGNIVELITGGAPMNAEVELFMKKIKFPFTIGYGMTECGPLISYANWFKHRFESSGKIVDGMQCRILSPDPQNIPGEVLLKGDQVFSGYYNNPEATAETLVDGWLHTGDIGTLDKDGFIYLKGRSKNMILGPSGENIYPELVEQKLNNLPYVGETLVLERDRQLHALIYPDMDALDEDHLKEADLPRIMEENRQNVNKVLASFSRIVKIHIVNEPFQKTPTQKIKRYLYR